MLFLCSALGAYSQNPTYEEIKPLLIVRFMEHIIWPNESSILQFDLGIYGTDTRTFNELSSGAYTIGDKTLNVRRVRNINNLSNLDALFISASEVGKLEEISRAVENKSILLISESSSDPKSVMINLLREEDGKTALFEVNRANIVLEGFEIAPQLMPLGGVEVDMRKVYREMKGSVNEMSDEIRAREALVKRTVAQMETLRKEIAIQTRENEKLVRENDQLAKENEALDKTNSELTGQIAINTQILNAVGDSLKEQRQSLLDQARNIAEQQNQLREQDQKLASQNELIEERSKVLDSISRQSKIQTQIIIDQNEDIVSKEDLIELQTLLIYVFVTFSAIVLTLAIITIRLYRKKVQALSKLEQTQVQLVQSEKMAALGVLTAGVAHEINNPTSFIKAGMEVLKKEAAKDKLDEKTLEELVAHMDLGVNRITNIVKSLGAFSRGDEESKEACELHTIIEDCFTILFHQYKGRIDIVKHYYDGELIINGNTSQLYQVFTNLISNSIQAIPESGTITVLTKSENDKTYVSIEDSGMGIRKEDLNKIFDPFFTTKDPGVGTGLGLSIVYKIIEDHEGKIEFESEPDKGTKVIITFDQVRSNYESGQ